MSTIERPEKWIRSEPDFLSLWQCKTRQEVERALYKYTGCGAFVVFQPHGIHLGSIVEGSDCGTMLYELTYPFTGRILDEVIAAIEHEADRLWEWANSTDSDTLDVPDIYLEYKHLPQLHRIA